MVARPDETKIKPSARRALSKTSALYLSGEVAGAEGFGAWRERTGLGEALESLPVYTPASLGALVERIKTIGARVAA
jgi:hypothetical protein